MKSFKQLLKMQEKLDTVIVGEGVYKKDDILENVRIALMVEIGELANEVASFKHWKKSHVMDMAKVMDEEADVMHFVLSLCNFTNIDGKLDEAFKKYDFKKVKNTTEVQNTNDYFIAMYGEVMEGNIGGVLHALILLNRHLGKTDEDLVEAYLTKNKENYRRVANGY